MIRARSKLAGLALLLLPVMAEAGQQQAVVRGAWLIDALKAGGCNIDWLSEVVQQNNLTETDLDRMPYGGRLIIPANCKEQPSSEIVRQTRALLRRLKPEESKPPVNIAVRESPQSITLPSSSVLGPELETPLALTTPKEVLESAVIPSGIPKSWLRSVKAKIVNGFDPHWSSSVVVFLLIFPLGFWFTKKQRGAAERQQMKAFGKECLEEFRKHFQNDPGKKIKCRIYCYPEQGRFLLCMKDSAGQVPSGPHHSESVRQKLAMIVATHKDRKFYPGAWTYRRGWIVIPFYHLADLEVAHEQNRSV